MNHAMRLLPILVASYSMLASAYEKREQRRCLTDANLGDLRQIATEIEKTLEMMSDDPEIIHHAEVFQSQRELFEGARNRFAYYLSLSRGA